MTNRGRGKIKKKDRKGIVYNKAQEETRYPNLRFRKGFRLDRFSKKLFTLIVIIEQSLIY